MNLIHSTFLGFVFVAIFLAFLFFLKKKGEGLANKFIGLVLLLFAFNLFYYILQWSDLLNRIPHLYGTYFIPMSLFGTLFYLYIKRVSTNKELKLNDIVHLTPLIFLFLATKNFFFQSKELKEIIASESLFKEYIPLVKYIELILVAFMILYSIKSFILVKTIDFQERDLRIWIKTINIAFAGVVLSFTIYFVLAYFGFLSSVGNYLVSFINVLFIGLVAYFAFMQPEVFNGKPMSDVIPFVKYKRSGLSKEVSLELKIKLLKLIDKDKIYLKNNLGLIDIAEILNITRNHASQVINEHFEMSFYDFINKYRILEAIKILNEDAKLNFTEIAYTVGFNNRVSFYKAFKKVIGLNPTQYVKGHKIT